MVILKAARAFYWLANLAAVIAAGMAEGRADGVVVRIKVVEPAGNGWKVKLGGYIHNDPWRLPEVQAEVPKDGFSLWIDLAAAFRGKLHGRLNRAGGVAEFPNVTADFSAGPEGTKKLVIELATAADEKAVAKRFEETFTGAETSFTVSPDLKKDAASLETASEMTARRLAWAREASGGKTVTPQKLWVQTSFWSPQRPELNVLEGEVLALLGFNLVGNQKDEVHEKWRFLQPGGHHWTEFGPALSREEIEAQISGPAKRAVKGLRPTLFNFSDEIACRPPIGKDAKALAHFRAWLTEKGLAPQEFGVDALDVVIPIETPPDLRERQKVDRRAANHTFVWTTRFRHESATQRIRWLTESFHRHAPEGILTSALVADHPYFGGSGLGMGMHRENTTWGGWPLSLDWFSLARERAVDVIGIEDWLGLQYMYGPGTTWEGFQLIGFQAALFRSGSRGEMPIITWITPSDETNLRLKSASALCQGAKHFFYWTYGPTATSTENYWSDLRSAYDGIVAITRQLAGAEDIIAPGKTRAARVAVLYSLSTDLWQPFGYVSMLERRLTYFSLIHDQFLVDFLTERDIDHDRLKDYAVLYVCDPNVSTSASGKIRQWVNGGGKIFGSAAAASRDDFDDAAPGLAEVFGIDPRIEVTTQPGRFDVRGALNGLAWIDQVKLGNGTGFGALGMTVKVKPAGEAKVIGTFADGSPAVIEHAYGKGTSVYAATCPAVSYAKDAKFAPEALKERWPAPQREFINAQARAGASALVRLSHPVVEAGIYDAEGGSALVLANFTYQPVPKLDIELALRQKPARVRSMATGPLKFESVRADGEWPWSVKTEVALGVNDIIILEH
ncbi:MAG: hypothetical protein ACR2OZ_04305 [Verrucomicrobiales bacterium]